MSAAHDPSRRAVLKGAIALATVPSITAFTDRRLGPVRADPFTLGVASGDPSPDGVVIWTRLASNPLADDGFGGMPQRTFDVEWQVAADERFRKIDQRGFATAAPEFGHTVHVDLKGLQPAREYFYRFRVDGHVSPVGRTRTAPPLGSLAAPLTMCVVACSHFEHGWFTAYRRLAEEEPDLVLHLGDYQYEYGAGGYEADSGSVRAHAGGEAVTLADYRQRYAQYKTDPDLQAAHAAAPWLVVFDDHEVDDNWADDIPSVPQRGFLARRAAALQAYYENMPLRQSSMPRDIHMQLYRRVHWGTLATFHMLDTRQYRDDQLCGDQVSACPGRTDPARSLTGDEQERWLVDGFQHSRAQWDLVGQQAFFSQLDLAPGPDRAFNQDAWDGYAANRDRIIAGLVNSKVRNAVVLSGDVHSHWAAEVRENFDDPSSRQVATEFVTTSITSGGDGSDTRDEIESVLPENPHIRYYSNRRGYVRTRIAHGELRADFRVLPFVSRRDAPAYTGASFVLTDRAAALDSV